MTTLAFQAVTREEVENFAQKAVHAGCVVSRFDCNRRGLIQFGDSRVLFRLDGDELVMQLKQRRRWLRRSTERPRITSDQIIAWLTAVKQEDAA